MLYIFYIENTLNTLYIFYSLCIFTCLSIVYSLKTRQWSCNVKYCTDTRFSLTSLNCRYFYNIYTPYKIEKSAQVIVIGFEL